MQIPLKTCSRCGIIKPVEEFAVRSNIKGGVVPRIFCKACDVPRRLTPQQSRRKQLRARYDLSPGEFQAMGDAQDWKCAICSEDISQRSHIDHNHVTGKLRKLLCFHCNLGLGHFRDSIENLLQAVYYLERRN